MYIKLTKPDRIVLLPDPVIKIDLEKLEIILESGNTKIAITEFVNLHQLEYVIKTMSDAIERHIKGYVRREDGLILIEIL